NVLDVAGHTRIVAQCLAQLRDCLMDDIVDHHYVGPDAPQHDGVWHDLGRGIDQSHQNGHGLRVDAHAADFVRARCYPVVPESENELEVSNDERDCGSWCSPKGDSVDYERMEKVVPRTSRR